jgi:2-(1,2-epoxy-1,2-dihydrophenyl)acetyl-CoA isomerase
MSEILHSERDGAALVLTLARPAKRNALSLELVGDLADAISAAPQSGARLVILTGEPPAFCSGGDLGQLSEIARRGSLAVLEQIYGKFHRLVRAIREIPVPVLAAVNGAALGAGLDLALACDMRIAAHDATFASSWINAGLVPGMGGAHMLPRLIGGARSAEALFLGRSITAREAFNWGLVGEVAAEGDLLTRAVAVADRIARQPPAAVALTKAAFRRGLDDGLDAELAVLGAVQSALLTSEEFLSLAARITRRNPSTQERGSSETSRGGAS